MSKLGKRKGKKDWSRSVQQDSGIEPEVGQKGEEVGHPELARFEPPMSGPFPDVKICLLHSEKFIHSQP